MDIQDYLKEKNQLKYLDAFVERRITIDVLQALSEIDLENIGIISQSDRSGLLPYSKESGGPCAINVMQNEVSPVDCADEDMINVMQNEVRQVDYADEDLLSDLKNWYLDTILMYKEDLIESPTNIRSKRILSMLYYCMARCLYHENIFKEIEKDENPSKFKDTMLEISNEIRTAIRNGLSSIFSEEGSPLEIESENYLCQSLALSIELYNNYNSSVFAFDIYNYIKKYDYLYEAGGMIFISEKLKNNLNLAKKILEDNVEFSDKFEKIFKKNEIFKSSQEFKLIEFLNKTMNFSSNRDKVDISINFTLVIFLFISSFGFLYFSNPLIKTIFLSVVLSSSLYLFLKLTCLYFPWLSSSSIYLTRYVSALVSVIYFVNTNPNKFLFIISIAIGCFSSYSILRDIWPILKESYVVREMWKGYRSKIFRKGLPGVVVILSAGGVSEKKMMKVGAKVNSLLSQSYIKGSLVAIFPTENFYNKKSWMQYIINNSDALIINDTTNIFSVIRDMLPLDSFCSTGNQLSYLQKLINDNELSHVKGNIITLQVDFGEASDIFSDIETQLIGSDLGVGTMGEITKILSNSSAPISWSDEQIDQNLYNYADRLRFSGFQPLAHAYLRFRIASSDVERFLALLDSIELLIRISVVFLLANRWSYDENDNYEYGHLLHRPTLGVWIHLLHLLVKSPLTPLDRALAGKWNESLPTVYEDLLSAANGSGLIWRSGVPRTHLGWLEWFVWLRNKTRGHGLVDEDIVDPLWHSLHETFLDLVRRFDFLIFDERCLTVNGVIPVGWKRFSSAQYHDNKINIDDLKFVFYECQYTKKPINLSPFFFYDTENIILWNSINDNKIEYINYVTGDLLHVPIKDSSLYSLWCKNSKSII